MTPPTLLVFVGQRSILSCSIEEFARYYTATTISFDGVVHFSQQGYADRCKAYPSNLSVICTAASS